MSVLVLDEGNSVINVKFVRCERGEVAFPHAIKSLTETEYSNILTQSGVCGHPPDYLRINGQPYVVGESTEHHGVHTQRTDSAQYTVDYYGIFAVAVLGHLYDLNSEVSNFRKPSVE